MGSADGFLKWLRRGWAVLGGEPLALPAPIVTRWPELEQVRWRRGGLPPRVGGWCLMHRSVAAITLWRTVFVAPHTTLSAPLLLHELRHVQQFTASFLFPVRYVWETLRRGYTHNRFEREANDYALLALRDQPALHTRDLRNVPRGGSKAAYVQRSLGNHPGPSGLPS